MRDHSKRFTLKEWSENYVDRVIQLGEDCDVEIELEPAPETDFRWAKADVKAVVDALVTICAENLSESQGGEGPPDAPFNDEFFEKLDGKPSNGEPSPTTGDAPVVDTGEKFKPVGHWSQFVIDALERAIERGCCSCCWHIIVEMDVDFVGNVQPNPQTPSLTTKAKCDATQAELVELYLNAFNSWLSENQDTFPEGGVTFTPIDAFVTPVPGDEDCEETFRPPVVES